MVGRTKPDDGGLRVSVNDIIKYGTILILLGGGVARYEMRQNAMDVRIANIEVMLEQRNALLARATAVLERWELDEEKPLRDDMKGVSSGASSRRGR